MSPQYRADVGIVLNNHTARCHRLRMTSGSSNSGINSAFFVAAAANCVSACKHCAPVDRSFLSGNQQNVRAGRPTL